MSDTDTPATFPAPLNELAPDDRAVLARFMETIRVPSGERLLEEGGPGDGCYVIDSGDVRIEVRRDHPDSENVIEVIGPGTILGELSLLDREPRSASAVADTDVTARRISTDDVDRLVAEHPRIGMALIHALGRAASLKLRKTSERLAEHLASDAPDPDVEEMMERAVSAQKEFESWSEERVDGLLKEIADAVVAEADALAEETVEETKMGRVADKAFKNRIAALGVLRSVAGQNGYGILGAEDGDVVEVAAPAGVIFGIIPVTNPVPTAVFKTLSALKGRNALVLSFHRASLGVGNRVGEIIEAALQRQGAPRHLVQWIRKRGSRKKTRDFMSHPRMSLILATGGESMVRAAYSSGTPAIGVGPGNAPAWVCADADLAHAARSVVLSKSFDYGLICGAEHNLVVDASVRDDFVEELERAGAAVLDPDEAKRFGAAALDPERGGFRMETVGQSAERIAGAVGIERDHPVELIVVPVEDLDTEHPYAGEKLAPILSLFTVDGDEEGLDVARALLESEGTGHTAVIHTSSRERARRFGEAMPASRILVNSPGSQGVCGITTGLRPSFTLGCGTFGGNSTTDNVSWDNLINRKRLAHFVEPSEEIVAMREASG